jgi:hypothetical protein
MRLYDDVVSADFAHMQQVLVGTTSEFDNEQHPLTTLLDDRFNIVWSLYDQQIIKADDVPDDKGILFTLLFKHPEFTEDPIHIEWITSHFVSEGTRCLLRGDVRSARGNAYFVSYFQQMMSFVTEEKMINSTKLMTLYTADEHTLCSYFRNRIPCSCLKYNTRKSDP